MEENNPNIVAIIVTYNRSDLLIRCLKAIVNQSLLPSEILIIDNHSNDATQQNLKKNGFITNEACILNEFGELSISEYITARKKIKVSYLYKSQNDGGAGGFYAGMKLAYEAGYDWLWMMDDDGTPDINQLRQLLSVSLKFNLLYSNALVIDELDHSSLSFSLSLGNNAAYYRKLGIIENEVNPFNGTFIHRKIIDKVGYVKRELYIWGDETEFTLRVKHDGFKIGTICTAYHFHPAKRIKMVNTIPFFKTYKCAIDRPPIYHRNYAFIFWKYDKVQFFKNLVNYTLAYVSRFKFKRLIQYYKYTKRGVIGDWRPIKSK